MADLNSIVFGSDGETASDDEVYEYAEDDSGELLTDEVALRRAVDASLLDTGSAPAVPLVPPSGRRAAARHAAEHAPWNLLDAVLDAFARDAARARALASRAENDDGLFDAFVRARYGAPGPPGARDPGARAARACLEAELLGPALAGAWDRESELLFTFWTAATRGRRADAPSAALYVWPALHALAIKDVAWLDACMSRQRFDELARLAVDAASAPEVLALLEEVEARYDAASDAAGVGAVRGCRRQAGKGTRVRCGR
ncbi:hypothetical protein JL720_12447 [Aureococcus anophagefferens]|nr:hypothetical protein JL720_12447 [Aureococcus anophagefferens]